MLAFYQPVQLLGLHTWWWSLAATCAGGIFLLPLAQTLLVQVVVLPVATCAGCLFPSTHWSTYVLHLRLSNLYCVVVYIRVYIYIYILPCTTGLHTGNPTPFLYTPTSLLPEHSVLTDVPGRNGQQWITCRSGGQGTRPKIWMGSELVVNSSNANSATLVLGSQHPNGLYHCLSAQSQREYFSLYLSNSGKI